MASIIYVSHDYELRNLATHKRNVKHTRSGNEVMILYLKVPEYYWQGCGC